MSDQIQETTSKELDSMFIDMLPNMMDGDINGFPTMPGLMQCGDKLEMMSFLQMAGGVLLDHVTSIFKSKNPDELVFGLDRYNKEDQGVDMHYSSVLCIFHYKNGYWRFGAWGYNSPEDHYTEVDWWNEHWIEQMKKDLKMFDIEA